MVQSDIAQTDRCFPTCNRSRRSEKTPTLTSYWDTAYKEFSDEGKIAVKKGKSKDAKEVLKDLETLQKSIAATEEISGSGIAAGTLKMIDAIFFTKLLH